MANKRLGSVGAGLITIHHILPADTTQTPRPVAQRWKAGGGFIPRLKLAAEKTGDNLPSQLLGGLSGGLAGSLGHKVAPALLKDRPHKPTKPSKVAQMVASTRSGGRSA